MWRLRPEDGAVAVFVAILLSTVLLGMGALVLDVGSLYAERRELQNGADAGALAVAQHCASDPSTCTDGVDERVSHYADANASDNLSDFDVTDPSSGQVIVDTWTKTSSGTVIRPILARTLLGNESYEGTRVHASATAVWGEIVGGRTLPITVAECEYDSSLAGGWTTSEHEATLYLKFEGGGKGTTLEEQYPNDPCVAAKLDLASMEYPGGFGFLDTVLGNGAANKLPSDDPSVCAAISDTTTFPGSAGNSWKPTQCGDKMYSYLGQDVLLPIFVGDVNGTGANGTYSIGYYAAFHLTAYDLGSYSGAVVTNDPLTKTDSWSCPDGKGKDQRCLRGYFTGEQFFPDDGSFHIDVGATGATNSAKLTN